MHKHRILHESFFEIEQNNMTNTEIHAHTHTYIQNFSYKTLTLPIIFGICSSINTIEQHLKRIANSFANKQTNQSGRRKR